MKVPFTHEDHTFVICAYGECAYLEECIRSVVGQTVKTNVILATSTPLGSIRALAEKYGIPVFVNRGETGIAGDWNFAISCAETKLVTIAHQDDVYEPDYAGEMLAVMNRSRRPILFFSDYRELRGGEKVHSNRLLRIKRILRIPMTTFPGQVWARRLSLCFGNSISCPTVTYVKSIMDRHPFRSGFRSDLDWQMWELLSREKGCFAFSPKALMCHRIHADSETSHVLESNARQQEDYAMFRKFWPEGMARRLQRMYSGSEKSNQL